MKNIYTLWVSFVILGLFSGCSFKNYASSEANLITIKTANLKFSDIGYFRSDDESVQVELYSSGVAVEKFEINHIVCTKEGCLSKNAFNEDYLNENYPDDLLKNVLRKKPIYDAKNITKNEDGFKQTIVTDKVSICYKVEGDSVRFKDSKNRILIKYKKMKP